MTSFAVIVYHLNKSYNTPKAFTYVEDISDLSKNEKGRKRKRNFKTSLFLQKQIWGLNVSKNLKKENTDIAF